MPDARRRLRPRPHPTLRPTRPHQNRKRHPRMPPRPHPHPPRLLETPSHQRTPHLDQPPRPHLHQETTALTTTRRTTRTLDSYEAFCRSSSSSWVLTSSRSEEHTSELQSRPHLVCRLLLEKKNDASCAAL